MFNVTLTCYCKSRLVPIPTPSAMLYINKTEGLVAQFQHVHFLVYRVRPDICNILWSVI